MKSLSLKLAMVFIIALIFGGCASGAKPFGNNIKTASIYHDKNKTNGTQIIKIPKLNKINAVEVGENLYSKINQISYDTYRVTILEETKSNLGTANLNINLQYKESKNQPLYSWQDKKAMCFHLNDGIYSDSKICLIDTENKGYFSVSAYNYKDKTYPLSNKASYQLQPTPPSFNENSFKYVALYQGKVGNIIKISFREFKKNMARPAFTQDIEYELEKDGTAMIGFKGLRIKVLKATNMDIKYKVVKDYK